MLFFLGIFRRGLDQSVRSLKTCRAKIGSMTDFSWIGSPKLHLGSLSRHGRPLCTKEDQDQLAGVCSRCAASADKGRADRERAARQQRSSASQQESSASQQKVQPVSSSHYPVSRCRHPVSRDRQPVSRSFSQSAGSSASQQ